MLSFNRETLALASCKHPLVIGFLLLGLAAIPDVMVVPVLKALTVDRFGVSEASAHYFMAVNLLGALIAVFILGLLNKRLSTAALLIISALMSAILMASMTFITSWSSFLALRCIEGATDLVLLAIPLRLIASAGKKDRFAGRMGGGFTVMMLAMAIGAGFGGQIGEADPGKVLWAGCATMLLIALLSSIFSLNINKIRENTKKTLKSSSLIPSEWFGGGFLILDRGLAALISTSMPILLASGFAIGSTLLGMAFAGMFIALAIFAVPAGILSDKYGGKKVRFLSSVLCGLSLSGLGLMVWFPAAIILPPCLLLYGVGAAGLMPSAFATAVRPNASNLVYSSLQAAGQAGYAGGVLGGMLMVSIVALPADEMITRLFPITGVLFILCNIMLLFGIRTLQSRVS